MHLYLPWCCGTATSASLNICFLSSASLLNLAWISLFKMQPQNSIQVVSQGQLQGNVICFLSFKIYSPLLFLSQCLKIIVSIILFIFLVSGRAIPIAINSLSFEAEILLIKNTLNKQNYTKIKTRNVLLSLCPVAISAFF